jgi:hypothetical protein
MSDTRDRETIEALVAALNAGDLEALDRVFTDDIVMEWPQSGERIVGAHNRREIYSRFPALPHVAPRKMLPGRRGTGRSRSRHRIGARRGWSGCRRGIDGHTAPPLG